MCYRKTHLHNICIYSNTFSDVNNISSGNMSRFRNDKGMLFAKPNSYCSLWECLISSMFSASFHCTIVIRSLLILICSCRGLQRCLTDNYIIFKVDPLYAHVVSFTDMCHVQSGIGRQEKPDLILIF